MALLSFAAVSSSRPARAPRSCICSTSLWLTLLASWLTRERAVSAAMVSRRTTSPYPVAVRWAAFCRCRACQYSACAPNARTCQARWCRQLWSSVPARSAAWACWLARWKNSAAWCAILASACGGGGGGAVPSFVRSTHSSRMQACAWASMTLAAMPSPGAVRSLVTAARRPPGSPGRSWSRMCRKRPAARWNWRVAPFSPSAVVRSSSEPAWLSSAARLYSTPASSNA
mmetsp:Transcript_47210/g.81185  ORF Transcript_47210/g.81185 Transcript_47210/m.81185 type:complete len:229 (-) Transcript_47210:411-1097(-)